MVRSSVLGVQNNNNVAQQNDALDEKLKKGDAAALEGSDPFKTMNVMELTYLALTNVQFARQLDNMVQNSPAALKASPLLEKMLEARFTNNSELEKEQRKMLEYIAAAQALEEQKEKNEGPNFAQKLMQKALYSCGSYGIRPAIQTVDNEVERLRAERREKIENETTIKAPTKIDVAADMERIKGQFKFAEPPKPAGP